VVISKLDWLVSKKLIFWALALVTYHKSFSYWKVFSSSQGLKIGRVVGYSAIPLFLRRVPSSFLSGYVASMMGNCSLIDFSRLLGVTTNWKQNKFDEIKEWFINERIFDLWVSVLLWSGWEEWKPSDDHPNWKKNWYWSLCWCKDRALYTKMWTKLSGKF